MDLIAVIRDISGLIEKVVAAAKGHRDIQRAKAKLRAEEAKQVLEDVSALIHKFSDSIDVILAAIESWGPDSYFDIRSHTWLKANRRLFELATDMRILTHSLEKRFPGAEISAIQRVTDGCMQIISIEIYTLSLIPNNALKHLPIDPREGMRLWHEGVRPQDIIWLTGPAEARSQAVAYLNDLLLQLTKCRENLAKALLDVSQE